MASQNTPTRSDIDLMVTDFASRRFPAGEGVDALQLAAAQTLHDLGAYAIANATHAEAGAVVRGDAELTGSGDDDGVTVLVQLSRRIIAGAGATTTIAVTVDSDTPAIEQLRLRAIQPGPGVQVGALTHTLPESALVRHQIAAGSFVGTQSRKRLRQIGTPRRAELAAQAARILSTCPIDSIATQQFAAHAPQRSLSVAQ